MCTLFQKKPKPALREGHLPVLHAFCNADGPVHVVYAEQGAYVTWL